MSCRRIQSELSAYLDDELTRPMVEAVREHVAHCARCEAELARLEGLQGALRSWDAPKASRDFRERLGQKLAALSTTPGEPVGPEVAARERAAEREGVRLAALGAGETHASRSRRFVRTAKWFWVAAATIAVAVLVWRSVDRPDPAGTVPSRPDRSAGIVPGSPEEAADKIHFVLPSGERPLLEAESPDAHRLLAYAAARRLLVALDAGRVEFEDVRDDLAALSAEATGEPVELGALESAPRTARADPWRLPILGVPAYAGEARGRDADREDGLAAYRKGRFLEAARAFERMERRRPGSAAAASGLAHQVRSLAAAGEYERARELALRLHRDYPLHRQLAAILSARVDEAEANELLVKIQKKEVLEKGDVETRWKLALVQIRAWDYPAAAETLERVLLDPAAFEAEPVRASRAALLLVAVYAWMEEVDGARSVAGSLAARGAHPWREIALVEAALLDSLEGIDLAALGGPEWRSVRALVWFARGLEAERSGNPEAARDAFEAVAIEDPESGLARHVRSRSKS